VHLFTTQLTKWWVCKQHGIELVDVSNGNGLSMFIPSTDSYWNWKRGSITNEDFKQQYHLKMRESWNRKKEEWLAFMNQPHSIAIASYEPAYAFSHRYLLKDIFAMLCKNNSIEFYYYGEIE